MLCTVLNFKYELPGNGFFADTIGHSVFAGAALGGIFLGANGPAWGMPITALLIGLGVLFLQKQSKSSADTVIGVFLHSSFRWDCC